MKSSHERRLGIPLAVVLTLIFLSGCSQNSGKVDSNRISQTRFNSAISRLDITKSEWSTSTQIVGKRSGGNSNALQGKVSTSIDFSLQRETETSPWHMFIIGVYFGLDWMFHEQIDIKSSKGLLNIRVDTNSRRDQVETGFVTEISGTYLTGPESEKLCTLINGTSPQFRISGTGKTFEAVREILPRVVSEVNDICVVYHGLQQGLTIKKS
jgi:hypothetical protein